MQRYMVVQRKHQEFSANQYSLCEEGRGGRGPQVDSIKDALKVTRSRHICNGNLGLNPFDGWFAPKESAVVGTAFHRAAQPPAPYGCSLRLC